VADESSGGDRHAGATRAREPAAAAALIRFLNPLKAALVMKKKGMEPGAF